MNLGAADRLACHRFQSGLLTWLRAAAPREGAAGLREMVAVTRELAAADGASGDGLLWRSAGSFLQALLDGSLTSDDEARQVCRRLERHLSTRRAAPPQEPTAGQTPPPTAEQAAALAATRAADLAEAIFGFVSQRRPTADRGVEAPPPAGTGLDALLAGTFAATADVLPLLGPGQPRRYSPGQLAAWRQAATALDQDWHAVLTGARGDCRAAAIALLQTALELADAPGVRLAGALAEAASVADDDGVATLPAFRAAFADALEIASHLDGPEQNEFERKVGRIVERLAKAATPATATAGLVGPGTPYFAEDAREILGEMRDALDAVPPDRTALLSGLDWFVSHESRGVMAIRGLSTMVYRVVGRMRGDDLDEPEVHGLVSRTILALARAVDEFAAGVPPLADERVFAEWRKLDRSVATHRLRRADGAAPAVDDWVTRARLAGFPALLDASLE